MKQILSGNEKNLNQEAAFTSKIIVLIVMSSIFIALCFLFSITFGSRQVSLDEMISGLMGNNQQDIGPAVVKERIVRTVFSLIAGASLGVSGALMQAVTQNPIADPSILGVNTGASLFVVIGIAFFNINTAEQYIGLSFIGAGLTTIFVYAISSMGRGGATPIKLALAGAAASAALSSLVSAVILPRGQVMETFRFWQVGSVGGAAWDKIFLLSPFLIIGLLIGFFSAPALNALALGDDAATGLGVNTGALRIISAAGGVLLCASITALAGPISFIGLMAPHMVRLVLGSDQRILIPMSAVAGACVLTVSDVTGRLLGRPGELEAGVVTAFIGAPILVIIAIKSKVRSI